MQGLKSREGVVLVTAGASMPRDVLHRLSLLDRVRRAMGAGLVQAQCHRDGVRCVDLLAVTDTRLGYVVSLN